MMEDPLEQTKQSGQEEPQATPDGRYYQHMRDILATSQHTRRVLWELYRELQSHHAVVQASYDDLLTALGEGQVTSTLWNEYREAITQHRLLVNRLRLAMQQQRLRDDLLAGDPKEHL
jgi:hypothetical protein